jgi:arsenate reductase
MAEIWHNPRCSKSRATLELLEAHYAPEALEIVAYLESPPSRPRLAIVADALSGGASELLRAKDAPSELANASDAEILDALASTPALIERPVVITSRGTLIARPPERVREVLE